MGESDLVEDASPRTRNRRDAAWILLVGLLVSLFAVTGAQAAGAEKAPPGCADGSSGQTLTLPSGASETLCTAAADEGGAATNAASSISLAKTVGTDENTCANTDTLAVASGTEVFYCYTVTNTGAVTVSVHDLEDDKLGTLLNDFAYVLSPGASKFVTASATITADTVNVATWTASDGVDSSSSVDSATVTIAEDLPDAPSTVSATASEGAADVTWDVPASDGGSPIVSYEVTPYVGATPGTSTVVAAPATTATIDGLTNGTTYTFKVAATTAVGTGPQSPSSNEVTPEWWLPWSSGDVAVTEMFTWMTGVAPTGAEKAAWLADLDAGDALPGDLIAALRAGADATTNVDPTIRLYSAYLLRIPDKSGLNFWLGRRRSGWTLARISANFANSNEFKNRYGTLTNQEFVELVYQNVLGRDGDAAGISFWTNRLNNGTTSRGQLMINFSESNEYKTKQANKVHAAAIYIHFLGKTPTVSERDAFVDDLVGGASIAELVRELIHAPSFDARAG